VQDDCVNVTTAVLQGFPNVMSVEPLASTTPFFSPSTFTVTEPRVIPSEVTSSHHGGPLLGRGTVSSRSCVPPCDADAWNEVKSSATPAPGTISTCSPGSQLHESAANANAAAA
jgi:hypothetical protein